MSLINDLKTYNRQLFFSDLIAALTVAVILIPQGMAYALLAGLSPIYGLYASVVPLLIYPFLGSSKYLSVGPVALISIITFAGISPFAEPDTHEFLLLILFTSFIAGVIQVGFSLFKLGFLSNFLSRSVITGFISAAGVIILISQIKNLASLRIPRGTSTLATVESILYQIEDVNMISLLIGGVSILLILLFKKMHKLIPGALIMVVVGSLLVMLFHLDEHGVAIVGEMSNSLPKPTIEFFNIYRIPDLFPTAFALAVIGFIGSYAIGKSIAEKDNKNFPNANKELLALGLSKVIGSFISIMPTSGSFSRSFVNYEAGAKTSFSSIITAIFVFLTIAFFGSIFYYLPRPVLAAIIITSVLGLIDIKEGKKLFRLHKSDFWVMLITFVSTILLGIVNGVMAGIILSLITVIFRTSIVSYAVLGRLPNKKTFRNLKRYEEAESIPNILIIRVSQSLFFGNAEEFIKSISRETRQLKKGSTIILSMPTHNVPDATATYEFFHLVEYCESKNIRLVFTDVTGPVRDLMRSTGLYYKIGPSNFFLDISDAVEAIQFEEDKENLSNRYSGQSNYEI